MTDAKPTHPLLLNLSKESAAESPRSMLDGLLQRWVEDIMTQQKEEKSPYNLTWQPAVLGRNLESFAPDTVLWGQATVVGMNNPSQAAPIVMLAANNSAIRLIVESFLGPKSMENTDDVRPYTTFEQNLVERFWTHILDVLSQTWRHWETSTAEKEGVTFQWGGVSNQTPNLGRVYDGMMAWPLTIKDPESDEKGTFYLIVPHVTLEPLLPQLQARFSGDSLGHDLLWQEHWQSTMSEAVCTLEVRIPSVALHLCDVLKWKVGTQIDIPALTIAHAYCHDYHVMTGSVGHKNGHMAFQMQLFDTHNERSYP